MRGISGARAPTMLLGLLLSGLLAGPSAAEEDGAAGEVRSTLRAMFEKPGAPLDVDPVVIESGYAVVGWTQDDRGGRALLKHAGGNWEVQLCAGDALKAVATLLEADVAPEVAARLSEGLAAAEKLLSAPQLEKFASFRGLLNLRHGDAHGGHRRDPGEGAHHQ